jgi:hypothetical protein
MKLTELNESVTELERLDELDLSAFKAIAKKVGKDIQKVYYNSIKGEQTPDAQRAFDKLQKVLSKSSLDKEWADEIFKDFDHTKVDLTREEVEFYITQVQEADAYIKTQQAIKAAAEAKAASEKAEKEKKERLLVGAEREFDRLTKLQSKVKKHNSKIAKNRQKKIDTLEKEIEGLRASLED